MAGFRCYIDGLNLYYGMLKGTDLKWLDPVALCERLADDRPDLVRYFTARVTSYPTNRGAHQRQDNTSQPLTRCPRSKSTRDSSCVMIDGDPCRVL